MRKNQNLGENFSQNMDQVLREIINTYLNFSKTALMHLALQAPQSQEEIKLVPIHLKCKVLMPLFHDSNTMHHVCRAKFRTENVQQILSFKSCLYSSTADSSAP